MPIEQDISFLQKILPKEYTVCKYNPHPTSVRCMSNVGVSLDKDNEDPEHWEYIMAAIESHFNERFIEIRHFTQHNHLDFVVYLK